MRSVDRGTVDNHSKTRRLQEQFHPIIAGLWEVTDPKNSKKGVPCNGVKSFGKVEFQDYGRSLTTMTALH